MLDNACLLPNLFITHIPVARVLIDVHLYPKCALFLFHSSSLSLFSVLRSSLLRKTVAMAAPEIDLAEDELGRISEGTIFDNESKADLTDVLTSDSMEKERHGNVLNSSSPVIYHYLTFESVLPSLANLSGPCQPDLKKFTSPFDWPESRKNFMVWLSCIATLITAYTAGSYSPAISQMTAEWNVSEVAALVGITSFCCGFAIAPMVLAPFSEIQGR